MPISRVLLVAETTGYQIRSFQEAAQQLGVELLLATDRCHVLDDPWRDGAVPIRFYDEPGAVNIIQEAAVDRPLDGIIAVGDRPAVIAAAAAHALGLDGHKPDAVRASGNKLMTRHRLREYGLLVPWFLDFPVDVTLSSDLPLGVSFPCVVKPLSMAASCGVIRVDRAEDLAAAVSRVQGLLGRSKTRALRDPSSQKLLIEAYIPGREVAIEGVLTQGRLQVFAIFDKPNPLEGPFFEETIYVTPSECSLDERRCILENLQRAIEALGLSHGPIHAECRLNTDGVFVLEIAARPIGGLCSKTLRFYEQDTKYATLESVLLRHAIGDPVTGYRREKQAAGVMMIPIPSEGRFRHVGGVETAKAVKCVEEVVITAKRDQLIAPPPNGDSYLGFIFARGSKSDEVVEALRTAHERLKIEILPLVQFL